ncbi:MAG: DUF58 domain-containing protein [Spirochaetales bacterium]|jgi:uncharacterized protein (DUF58 family)|nr:DUF58 domain-containing protein [Spirochaetales bacterium]
MKPGVSLFVTALLWLLLGAAGYFFDTAALLWTIGGGILLLFIIADALFLFLLTDRLAVSREVSSSQALGEPGRVTIKITRSGDDRSGRTGFLPAAIRLFDLYPDSMSSSAFPAVLERKILQRRGTLVFEYPVLPLQRGPWTFPGLHLLLGSPLRFWRYRAVHACASGGRTYPDFKKLGSSAGVDLQGVSESSGLKNIRRRGQGLEFESLREYMPGDSIRAIDWRATSRRRKFIVREYREEQDQQVLFLLDSGYRLHRREGEYTQFDSALNAVLLLAWVALKHGDSVAACAFGAEDRWLPMRKGMSGLTGLMNGLYDLQSSAAASSPFSALESALSRLHRRTFIILISNFREEDGESLSWILPRLQRRHLLLLVSFREMEAARLAARASSGPEEALESAAAFSYIASRRRLYTSWEHLGLLTLETTAAAVSSSLINRYLSVKRSGRL